MKVLLTGATGFVGSHILDSLRARQVPTAILVRKTSDLRWVRHHHLPTSSGASPVERREGSISDPPSLLSALDGITHVIHCAGSTKARFASDFYKINQEGTRNVVDAINAQPGTIRRLMLISSLAAAGPGTPSAPAREDRDPRPVSEYGKSKLAAEQEVRNNCGCDWVVIRPPGVYGPRDEGFLPLFQAVSRHILPCPKSSQMMSLVYVKDLAEAIVRGLDLEGWARRTYFVANQEIVSGRSMAAEIAAQARTWALPCPLPLPLLWSACLARHFGSRLSGRAEMLSLYKYPELIAAGWVCDASAFERDTGFRCSTGLREGIGRTLKWYAENKWLKLRVD